jgi:hypothetical protein
MVPPLRSVASALVSFWTRGQPTERAAYMVGALLLISGLIHVAILLIGGGSWQGPLSSRKAMTFGLSFGLTLITIVWVASFLRLNDRERVLLLGALNRDLRARDRAGHPAGVAGGTVSLQHGNDV